MIADRKKYFINIEDKLVKRLKKSRYRHTLGVAHTSACLAMRYGEDIDSAYLAGLLHDYAKNLDDDEMLKVATKNNLDISDFERHNPFILHGRVAACLVKDDFDIVDENILNAISYHTTGRPGMSRLEKIVFLADYLECGREEAADLQVVRELAFKDLDKCLLTVLSDTLIYLEEKGSPVDYMTQKTYDFYHDFH